MSTIFAADELPDTTAINALTRADAIESGHRCLARAKLVLEESEDKKVYSRINITGNRLETATYWNSRATAFYALAALLPA